jgi:hypothetical protein
MSARPLFSTSLGVVLVTSIATVILLGAPGFPSLTVGAHLDALTPNGAGTGVVASEAHSVSYSAPRATTALPAAGLRAGGWVTFGESTMLLMLGTSLLVLGRGLRRGRPRPLG